MKPTFPWETYSKNRQTPGASPLGVLPITTPTKENDTDRPWKVLPILNTDLYSVSWLLAYSSIHVEDIFLWHHLCPGGWLKDPVVCGEGYFSGIVSSDWYDNPCSGISATFCPHKEVSITGYSRPIFRPARLRRLFSGNASFNVHSILMFVRSDSRAV